MSFGIKSAGSSGTGGVGTNLYGGSPETSWQNSVFKAKLMPLTDLADRTTKAVDKVPTNDLLDDFKIGDEVGGIGKKTKQAYEGKISRIVKNPSGMGFKVFIVSNKTEKEIELLPSSLVFTQEDDINRVDMDKAAGDRREISNATKNRSAGKSFFEPAVSENNLKYLSNFKEFRSDI